MQIQKEKNKQRFSYKKISNHNSNQIIQEIISIYSWQEHQKILDQLDLFNQKNLLIILQDFQGWELEEMNFNQFNDFALFKSKQPKMSSQKTFNFKQLEQLSKNHNLPIGQIDEQKIFNQYEQFSKHIHDQETLQQNNYFYQEDFLNTISFIQQQTKNIVAIDCEMLETDFGLEVSRCSICDINLNTVFDQLIKPKGKILDYKTQFSGIDKNTYKNNQSISFEQLQLELQRFINKETILIGHSLENDLKVLKLNHDKIIDTSILFMKENNFKLSLKTLAYTYLWLKIQNQEHDSREDAKAAMALAKYYIEIQQKFSHQKQQIPYSNQSIIYLDRFPQELKSQESNINLINIENLIKQFETLQEQLKQNSNQNPLLIIQKIYSTILHNKKETIQNLENFLKQNQDIQQFNVFIITNNPYINSRNISYELFAIKLNN